MDRQTINNRIKFIENLLKNKDIKSLVDFDNVNDTINDTDIISQKQTLDFEQVILSLGGHQHQLEYAKSDNYSHVFCGSVVTASKYDYCVKVVPYRTDKEYGNICDANRPENAELKMAKVLSFFVAKKQTPHIVLPICTFNTNISLFTDDSMIDIFGHDNEEYERFLDNYKLGKYDSTCSILITECPNRYDLLFLLKHYYLRPEFTELHWKCIFFQLLSALAVIHSKYPSFRHNNLMANYILIDKIINTERIYTYFVAKKKYKVDNIGYQIKLHDFEFACISNVVNNSMVELKRPKLMGIASKQNRYYDIHTFFNTLIRDGFCDKIMASEKVPQEVKDFINRVLPEKYQNDPKSYELRDYIDKTLPDEYTNDKFGSQYINGQDIPPHVKSLIEDNMPQEYKNVRIGLVHEKGRLLVDDEYLTPQQILETDPFFEEFRVHENNLLQTNETPVIL